MQIIDAPSFISDTENIKKALVGGIQVIYYGNYSITL